MEPTVTAINDVLIHGHIGFEYVPLWGNILIAIWFWCLGGNVGSFMNVVVYRLPAGLSVVHPGSRCPRCRHAIRWYDNIPVLSWIVLRARCRDCGMPIASRYPTVEAMVAIGFVVVAFAGPIFLVEHLAWDRSLRLLRSPWSLEVWLAYACQMLALCTILCAALMQFDGHEPPRRLYVPALLVGMVAPLIWPNMHLVPFHVPIWKPDWLGALLDGLAGVAVGVSLGLLIQWVVTRRTKRSAIPLVVSLSLMGLVLGWQAVCAIGCVAVASYLVASCAGCRWTWLLRLPATAHVVFFSTVYIVFWSQIVGWVTWLGPTASIATYAVALMIVGLLTWGIVLVRPHAEQAISSRQTMNVFTGATNVTDSPAPNLQRILEAPSYLPAERDTEFLQRYELRPVRVQLELLKPEMGLAEYDVQSTIVAFGGTQIVEEPDAQERLDQAREKLGSAPDDTQLQRKVLRAERVLAKSKYYDAARKFSQIVSSTCQIEGRCEFAIVTGGGPGIMEAANRGAFDVGAKSIGLNVTLPEEQVPNPYITPDLCFQFHYFAIRKMHFLLRAKALVVFPGGYGTLDELFDALTLRQTKRMQDIPIILFGREYWERVIDFQFLADEGVIADEHLDLIDFAETPEEAWNIIVRFHGMESDV